ncbi:MAG: endolytic transglycosylase MltG [Bacteriovoracaceae bacterium]|nr:endolytic transglycosylase MltG [Bacteriovoracaceae bacterium]
MKKKIFISLVLAIFFGIIFGVCTLYYSLELWRYEGSDVIFEIKQGERFGVINSRLKNAGLIHSTRSFHRYAVMNNILTKFKSGKYLIKNGSNMTSIMKTLVYGKPMLQKVTIPEGKNLFEIGKILEEKMITTYSKFTQKAKERTFVHSLGIPADRAEGYLYPDTYHFAINTPPEKVINTMVQVFRNKTKALDFTSHRLSKHEIITLASIVEKETGAAWERQKIAGVFFNRLKKKMRLQTDPTIIYGMYEQYNGNIKREHKRIMTPYNTYRINGLPAGPISNPGLEAIRAVLAPEDHGYLYFVSKNDGTHIFSKTYKNHIKGVDKFQKNHLNRRGKSWRDLKKNNRPNHLGN